MSLVALQIGMHTHTHTRAHFAIGKDTCAQSVRYFTVAVVVAVLTIYINQLTVYMISRQRQLVSPLS